MIFPSRRQLDESRYQVYRHGRAQGSNRDEGNHFRGLFWNTSSDPRYAISSRKRHRIALMERSSVTLFCLLAVSIFDGHTAAQVPKVPSLGSQVPKQVLKARATQCLTDVQHHDPCALVKIHGILFTVAWDRETNAVTYISTSD